MENLLLSFLTDEKIAAQQNELFFADLRKDMECSLCQVRRESIHAVVYTRFSSCRNAERFLDYEREKGSQYCDLQEYQLYATVESIENKNIMEDVAVIKILELAEKGIVDVVVLTSVSGLFHNPKETFWFLDKLYDYEVKVDLVGFGNLDKAIFNVYVEESKKQEQEFQKMLTEFVSQWEISERDK